MPDRMAALIIALLLLVVPPVHAAVSDKPSNRVAILDVRVPAAMATDTGRLLSDVIRAASRDALPTDDYVVMTRENVLELLPPGTSLADCLGECSVEIGRKVQADYIVTGEILQVGDQMRGTLSLFDCRTANLLSQVTARGVTVEQLETDLLNETTALLLVLPNAARDQRGLRRQSAVAYREGRQARARGNRWLMIGAVAAGGFAAYAHVQSNGAWDDYQAANSAEQAAASWDDYSAATRQRDVALGMSGVLVTWRLWRALKGGPSEDEYYRDLILKNRLSAEITPSGLQCRLALVVCQF